MRNETDPNVKFAYEQFKNASGEISIKYVYVDKDLQTIPILRELFPNLISR